VGCKGGGGKSWADSSSGRLKDRKSAEGHKRSTSVVLHYNKTCKMGTLFGQAKSVPISCHESPIVESSLLSASPCLPASPATPDNRLLHYSETCMKWGHHQDKSAPIF
jgi:hypothetical protein